MDEFEMRPRMWAAEQAIHAASLSVIDKESVPSMAALLLRFIETGKFEEPANG